MEVVQQALTPKSARWPADHRCRSATPGHDRLAPDLV